jgi:hypothetical protein
VNIHMWLRLAITQSHLWSESHMNGNLITPFRSFKYYAKKWIYYRINIKTHASRTDATTLFVCLLWVIEDLVPSQQSFYCRCSTCVCTRQFVSFDSLSHLINSSGGRQDPASLHICTICRTGPHPRGKA